MFRNLGPAFQRILTMHLIMLYVSVFFIFRPDGASASVNDPEGFYRDLPSEITQDLSHNLEAVLPGENDGENCENYWRHLNPATEKVDLTGLDSEEIRVLQEAMIRCGKWMFFYLPLPTKVAMPNLLLSALKQTFPEMTGPAFSEVGFRENPREKGWPLELPRVPRELKGPLDIVRGNGRNMACTGCHLGQLPDGRYSVGMPNENLDLGRLNLMTYYPLWLAGHNPEKNHPWDPEVDRIYRDLFHRSKGRVNLPRALIDAAALLDLLNMEGMIYTLARQDPIPVTDQRSFYRAGRGQMNPATPMLSEPHHEIYVTPPPIWNMKHFEGSDIEEPYLGRITSSRDLEEFIRQGIVFSTLGTELATPRFVDPVAAYLRTLESPPPPGQPIYERYGKGQVLFEANCQQCHDGYGASTRLSHPLSETMSPLVFDKIFEDYKPLTRQSRIALDGLKKVGMIPFGIKGLKSRRLGGIWARERLSANGSIKGLDHLFCLNGKAREQTDPSSPLADSAHAELCVDYSEDEKLALREFLIYGSF